MSAAIRRNPVRERKEPERFKDMVFVKGSGAVGCDHYDSGYDRGQINSLSKDFVCNFRDRMDAENDKVYTRALQEKLNVEEAAQKLPEDMVGEIKNLVLGTSIFKNDMEFIVPDGVEPEIEKESEQEIAEWESDEDTDSEEEIFEFELEED